MSLLANIRVEKQDNFNFHKIYVDGDELDHVRSVHIDYKSDALPTCEIEFVGVTEVNERMLLNSDFCPNSIRECLKYLALQVQLDDDFRDSCLATIESALKESESCSIEDKAKRVLERLIE